MSKPPDPRTFRRLVTAALVAHLALASFGIADTWVWGAYGNHGAEYGGAALNMIRFGRFFFTRYWGESPPPLYDTKLKHPILWHQYLVPAYWALGEHEVTPRIVAVIFSALSLLAFAALARRLLGDRGGGLAALFFALEPHVVYFASCPDPQHAAMLGSLLGVLAYVRYRERPSWSRGAWVLAGFALGCLGEWPAYYVAFGVAAYELFSRVREPHRRVLGLAVERWRWAAFCAVILALFASHFLVASAIGVLDNLADSYRVRRSSSALDVYGARVAFTLARMHGPALLSFGGAFVAWAVARRILRRAADSPGPCFPSLVPGVFGFAVALNVVLFPNEFATHIYRSYFLSPVLAFAAAAVCEALVGRLRWRPAGLLVPVLAAATVVPSAVWMLAHSRAVGGAVSRDQWDVKYDTMLYAQEVARRVPRGGVISVEGLTDAWPVRYYLRRDQIWVGAKPTPGARRRKATFALVRHDRGKNLVAVARLARRHPATALGPFLLVDLGRQGGAILPQVGRIRAWSLVSDPPTVAWRWFRSAVRPPRHLARDDALAQRVSVRLGVPGAPGPLPAAGGPLDRRVLRYDLLALRGAASERDLDSLLEGATRTARLPLKGAEVIGWARTRGGRIRLFLRSTASLGQSAHGVRVARGDGPASAAAGVPPELWTPGLVYVAEAGLPSGDGALRVSLGNTRPRWRELATAEVTGVPPR